MSFQNSRFVLEVAKPHDSSEILEVIESGDFQGDISIMYTKQPDPYLSLQAEGEKVIIVVCRDTQNGKLCGVGSCAVRRVYVDGRILRAGYLMGLRIKPEYQKHLPILLKAYAFIHECTKDEVDLYYTTILQSNHEAQKMLEKKRKSMPSYNHIGDYCVYTLRTGGQMKESIYSFEKGGDMEEIISFVQREGKQYDFYPVMDAKRMEKDFHGLEKTDFYTLKDSQGEIIASAAAWDQQKYKQYIITGYKGVYKTLSKLPGLLRFVGYPPLPRIHETANFFSLSLVCIKDNDPEVFEYFIKKVAENSKQYDFFIVGFHESHPLQAVVKRMKHVSYKSKVYIVDWDNREHVLNHRKIYLECGLL
ncbi:MAG: hypothetical protein K0R80_309 [Clostridia bacterium]|nr:hypothetical protein [Clostridia bacterium]